MNPGGPRSPSRTEPGTRHKVFRRPPDNVSRIPKILQAEPTVADKLFEPTKWEASDFASGFGRWTATGGDRVTRKRVLNVGRVPCLLKQLSSGILEGTQGLENLWVARMSMAPSRLINAECEWFCSGVTLQENCTLLFTLFVLDRWESRQSTILKSSC